MWLIRPVVAIAATTALGSSMLGSPQLSDATPALAPWIDTHTHFDERDPRKAVQAAVDAASRENAATVYLQIPPFDKDAVHAYDAEVVMAAVKESAGRIAALGGGGSLNPMIMRSAATGDAGPVVQSQFKERAEALLRLGVAGFGEMAAEHFAGATPYESAPPDHPLYLLLADIAAEHGVPIDLHLEAVAKAMPLPVELRSPPNAKQLRPNMAAFERLLAHNRGARIIWAHLGTDFTGVRTPMESRRLLRLHPNLFFEIKHDPGAVGRNPILVDGKMSAEWLALFLEFPDRFLIGSDQHYPEQGEPVRWSSVVAILNQLPPALRDQIGASNARRVLAGPTRVARRAKEDPSR
jgi:predicted TIM-barrel fold metal-dependent hydrolase